MPLQSYSFATAMMKLQFISGWSWITKEVAFGQTKVTLSEIQLEITNDFNTVLQRQSTMCPFRQKKQDTLQKL